MPLNSPIDTRVAPGSNEAPDYAKQVTDRIADEYKGLTNTLAELNSEASRLPEIVSSDADALTAGALIKRFRDLDSRVESVRTLEKEPYLRGGNAVDAFFNSIRDKIGKRNKNDRKAPDGATDKLQSRINVYQNQKLAEEQARREALAAEAKRIADDAERRRIAEAQKAEELRLAAERARLPHTAAAKSGVASQQEVAASIAETEAAQRLQDAEEARLATLAKPSDMARLRGNAEAGGGVTLTVAQEPYAILTDRTLVDMNVLRPFFTDAEIEKALRGWARTTGHRIKMDGAEIGHRNKGVTR